MSKKIKVWKKGLEYDFDKYVYVRLYEDDHQDVGLIMVDKEGKKIKQGNILEFNNQFKTIILHSKVTEEYPFKTDLTDCPLYYTDREVKQMISTEMGILSDLLPDLIRKKLSSKE